MRDKFSNCGVVTMAHGPDRYYEQACNLAISLRINMPELPIALITDRENIDKNLFSHHIMENPQYGGGVRQKIYLDIYSPFEETLFLDSDCIVTKNFSDQLEKIREYEFSPVCSVYLDKNDSDDFVNDLRTVLDFLDAEKFPKFNGGLYFFRKGSESADFFEVARSILENYKRFGVKDFDHFGPNEETIFSLALAKLKITNLYDDKGFFMRPTINVQGDFWIDPLGGGCRFRPWNVLSEPAICHFVRNNVFDRHYLKCEMILRREYGMLSSLAEKIKILTKYCSSIAIYQIKMAYYYLMAAK